MKGHHLASLLPSPAAVAKRLCTGMAAAVAALIVCSVLLPLAFLLGLHRTGHRSEERAAVIISTMRFPAPSFEELGLRKHRHLDGHLSLVKGFMIEEPDWNLIRAKQDQIAFLFGVDDHYGPLNHLEEISKHALGFALLIEKEGHTHGYCCMKAGSFWVADYIVNFIKNQMLMLARQDADILGA